MLITSIGDRPALPVLKQQFSISELIVHRGDTPNHMVGSEETGLQVHTEENCLYCVGAIVLGYPTQPLINSTHSRTGKLTRAHIQSFERMRIEPNRYFKECFFLPIFSRRFCRLSIMGRPERPPPGGDATVKIFWGVRLQ